MRIYTLPHPTGFEKKLMRCLGEKNKLADWKIFQNGENFLRVKKVGSHVGIIGRTEPPGDNFFQTLLLVDTLRRNGAKKITVFLPYFGYSRQDRQQIKGESVAASCLITALKAVGATKIVTLDLHSNLIAKDSSIPVKNVSLIPKFSLALTKDLRGEFYSVVSPDKGGLIRAKMFANKIKYHKQVAWIEKFRGKSGKPRALMIHGRTQGEIAVLVDDILDTGRTIEEAVRLLQKNGFRTFFLCITHPIFSDGAAKLIQSLKFKKILVSNTLPLPSGVRRANNIKIIDATTCFCGNN